MLLPYTCRALNRVRHWKWENIRREQHAAHPRSSLFHNIVSCIQTRAHTHTAHEDVELVCFKSALDVSFVFDCSASIVNDFVDCKNKNKFIENSKSLSFSLLVWHYQNIKSTLMIDSAKMKFLSAWLRLSQFALLKAFSSFQQHKHFASSVFNLYLFWIVYSCKRLVSDAIGWSANAIDDLCK